MYVCMYHTYVCTHAYDVCISCVSVFLKIIIFENKHLMITSGCGVQPHFALERERRERERERGERERARARSRASDIVYLRV
jgi:hypothetical protein